jgi:UDP-2,4-diacetamido-2,4,6-trideoxy-beta-L-altropyranose hydrolase
MDKNILIRVDANHSIGYGHFFRCFSLALILKENFIITFAIAGKSAQQIENILSINNFKLIELPQNSYVHVSVSQSDLKFDLSDIMTDKYTLVVLDGYRFGLNYQKELRKYSVLIAKIDDFVEGNYCIDLLINHIPGLISKNFSSDAEKFMKALGSEYALLRPPFFDVSSKLISRRSELNIFVCFGATDVFEFTEKILNFLVNINSINEVFIITNNSLLRNQFSNNSRFIFFENLNSEQMLDLMLKSNIGIFPSSGILYEAISAGLKSITCWQTDNQKAFHDFVIKNNIAYSFGDNSKGFDLKKFKASFYDCLNDKVNINLDEIRNQISTSRFNYISLFNSLMN